MCTNFAYEMAHISICKNYDYNHHILIFLTMNKLARKGLSVAVLIEFAMSLVGLENTDVPIGDVLDGKSCPVKHVYIQIELLRLNMNFTIFNLFKITYEF